MADLIHLHEIRQVKGKQRQKRHSKVLDDLDNIMKPVKSPYDPNVVDRNVYDRLRTHNLFISGSIGYEASILNSEYIYRLTSAYKLAKVFQEHNNWIFKVRPSTKSVEKVFNVRFRAEFPNKNTWINLTKCAKGNLIYKRNFSFWTSEEYDHDNMVTDSFRVGLATDWFDKLGIILRCKFSEVYPIDIRVPTVIDAFDQPIFHPRRDSISPKNGMAIHINCDPLTLGKQEFVVGEIPADKIEFRFVEMKDKERLGIEFAKNTGNLWDRLYSYYQTL